MEPPVVYATFMPIVDDLVEGLADRGVETRVVDDEGAFREALSDAEVAVVDDVEPDHLAAAPDLRWLQTMNAGVDGLPLDAVEDQGVALTNASGVHAEPAGEQILAAILAFERSIHTGVRQQVRGEWARYESGEVRGKTLGVVGLGAIGGRAAELGAAVGMDVVGTKRDPATAPDAVDEAFAPDRLATVLDRADYLALACPLTDETRGLVGAEELARLGDDGLLVNVARGAVVDQPALVAALEDGTIRGAVLDVFEEEPLPENSPLWEMENVVVTPHVAGMTPHYAERLAEIVARNVRVYREDGVDALENRIV